jgi:hypothetical protein
LPDPTDPGGLLRFLVILAVPAGVLLLLARALREIGIDVIEAVLLLVGGPLATALVAPWSISDGPSLILANVAGFVIPVVVAGKILLQRRVAWWAAVVAVAVSGASAFFFSASIPSQGILLFYRIPAVITGGTALLLTRARWSEAGPLAFLGGSLGVVLGADFGHMGDLVSQGGPQEIVIGGAGMFDGIFLCGLLSMLLVLACLGFVELWQGFIRKPVPDGPARPAASGPTPAAGGAPPA